MLIVHVAEIELVAGKFVCETTEGIGFFCLRGDQQFFDPCIALFSVIVSIGREACIGCM